MKKILPSTLFFITIILLNACKKDSNSTTQPNLANKVKSYTEDYRSVGMTPVVVTFNLAYDGNNRVTSLISAASSGDKFLLAYPSKGKISMDVFGSNILTLHEESYINNNGFLDSTFQYNDTQDTTTEKYIYNTANQLISLKEYDYSAITGVKLYNTTTSTYNSDGDLISTTDTDNNKNDFEYDTNLSYVSPVVFGLVNPNAGKKFHLLKKQTQTSNGYSDGSIDYVYTFDGNDRISTEKATGSDGTISIKTYTYF